MRKKFLVIVLLLFIVALGILSSFVIYTTYQNETKNIERSHNLLLDYATKNMKEKVIEVSRNIETIFQNFTALSERESPSPLGMRARSNAV